MTLADTFILIQERFPALVLAAVAIFGCIVGSFLNVCIARIPLGRSIVVPGSHCACGRPIFWYDNIPVLSWFLLRGRCRPCGVPYSFRYPLVEALTGLLFALTWSQYSPMAAVLMMTFLSLLIVATFIDLDYLIIPDRISVGGAIAGVILSFAVPALHGFAAVDPADHFRAGLESLLGLFVGTALVYWIALLGSMILKKDAMGEGDMKLLACIGAFTGWQGAVFSLFGGAALGILVFLPIHFLQRKRRLPLTAFWTDWEQLYPVEGTDPEKRKGGLVLPFGPMLALGAVVYCLFLRSAVDAYFENLALIL